MRKLNLECLLILAIATGSQVPLKKDEHAIFDRIAESMEYAKTYNLGDVVLQQRFDEFDRQADQIESKARKRRVGQVSLPVTPARASDISERARTAEFVQDLDLMKQGVSESQNGGNSSGSGSRWAIDFGRRSGTW